MNRMYEALEYCLQALEDGADMNAVLARFPDLADELRPILEASIAARQVAVPEPSADAVRRGRARLLQRAAELREAQAPSRPRVIPVFQRLAIAFTLTALFLASGTGLVRASASALPGENLYPVKRTWEGLRLLLVFDAKLREALQSEYEDERLEEVSELLTAGRRQTIQFAGVLMDLNGTLYVSGIRVVIVESTTIPADGLQNGAAVIVTGHTNAEGFVEADAIAVLPQGSIVPVGNPIKMEGEGENTNSSGNEASGSGNESESETRHFRVEGVVQAASNGTLVVDGQTVYLVNAEIEGTIAVGVRVKVEGYYAADGRFIVTKVEVEEDGSNENQGGENSGSNSNEAGNENGSDENSNEDSSHNENSNDENSNTENTNSENSIEDNSGSGGGEENSGD